MTKPHQKTEAYKEVTELNKVYDELNSIHKKIDLLLNKISHMATEREEECHKKNSQSDGILQEDEELIENLMAVLFTHNKIDYDVNNIRRAFERLLEKQRSDEFYNHLAERAFWFQ